MLKDWERSWSHGSWIYKYLCNQCLSTLKFWVRIPLRRGVLDTTLCDKICQRLAVDRWFPSSINWPPRYNWNIVESGVKYHTGNPFVNGIACCCFLFQNIYKDITFFSFYYIKGGVSDRCLDCIWQVLID